jgi:divalent metal cation (Fe/Co/Zn/Cd) transporter
MHKITSMTSSQTLLESLEWLLLHGKRNQSHTSSSLISHTSWVSRSYESAWMVDPLVAMLIALWIIVNWASTGRDLVKLIMGHAASPIYLQYLTSLAMNHDDRIKAVDTVRAYFMGEGLFVEIDVVLDETMPLREAHDIGRTDITPALFLSSPDR